MPLRILKAQAGRITRSGFKRNKGRQQRNVSQGFYAGGQFHPIRAAADYDAGRADEGTKRKTKKKVKAKAKAKVKTRPKPKAKAKAKKKGGRK